MTGACQVCGRIVSVAANGIPSRNHNRTVDHNPDADDGHEVVTSPCRGSNRPVLEVLEQRAAEREGRDRPLHGDGPDT